MKLDYDAIRSMIVLLVKKNMLTGNQIQAVVAFEEETCRVCQRGIPLIGEDRRHAEQHRFDRHGDSIQGFSAFCCAAVSLFAE